MIESVKSFNGMHCKGAKPSFAGVYGKIGSEFVDLYSGNKIPYSALKQLNPLEFTVSGDILSVEKLGYSSRNSLFSNKIFLTDKEAQRYISVDKGVTKNDFIEAFNSCLNGTMRFIDTAKTSIKRTTDYFATSIKPPKGQLDSTSTPNLAA